MTSFLLCDQLSSRSSRKFRGGEIPTLIRPAEIIRDLQRAPKLATLHAIDSRSKDGGNDEFLLCDQLSSLSSRKFRRGEIATLIRPAEIIRDLQSAPTLATLRAADSRSRDCGNDEFLLCDQLSSRSSRKFRGDGIPTLIRPVEIIRDLQRAPKLATLHAIDSRSEDCGNDGVLLCDQLSRLVILEISWRWNTHLDKASRNYPGSTACANVGNFTRCRFPLRRRRE
jgi:hypothetical protein